MNTLTIKIKNNKVLKVIQDLESLNLIQVIKTSSRSPSKRLSSEMSGSISEEQADSMQKELEQNRGEWERGI
jgi:hypothetical protein